MAFYSVGGMTHKGEVSRSGDRPRMVERPVIDPETGATLYNRKVYEGDFTSGFDPEDGLSFSGQKLRKMSEHADIKNARVTSEYKVYDHDGKVATVEVDMERDSERGWVIARTRDRRCL